MRLRNSASWLVEIRCLTRSVKNSRLCLAANASWIVTCLRPYRWPSWDD